MLAALSERAEHRPRIVIYPEGYHMLTRDLRADTVLQDISRWIGAADHAALSDELPGNGIATESEFCGSGKY